MFKQTNIGIVSRAAFGETAEEEKKNNNKKQTKKKTKQTNQKKKKNGVERVWVISSSSMPSLKKTETQALEVHSPKPVAQFYSQQALTDPVPHLAQTELHYSYVERTIKVWRASLRRKSLK